MELSFLYKVVAHYDYVPAAPTELALERGGIFIAKGCKGGNLSQFNISTIFYQNT
jgi:hypothetical protein